MTHVPDAPAAEKSEDEVQEEIKRYLKFEGGRGELQAPLVWWKVSGWAVANELAALMCRSVNIASQKHARDAGITEGIPELLWGGVVPFGRAGDATDWHSSRVDQPTPVSFGHEQPVDQTRLKVPKVNRAHHRLVFKNCGIPITQFRTKNELLEVLIELIQSTCSCGEMMDLSNSRSSLVHDRLVENGLLHRDISIQNVMILQVKNTGIYRGYLIDFDYCTILQFTWRGLIRGGSHSNPSTTNYHRRTTTIYGKTY